MSQSQHTLYRIEPLLKALDNGEIILTPNRRLSSRIGLAYEQYQTLQGHKTWLTPQVHPLSSWLLEQWQLEQHHSYSLSGDDKQTTPRRLLSNQQTAWLWQQAIAKTSSTPPLIKAKQAAQQAQSAYAQILLWRQNLTAAELQTTRDSQQFIDWGKTFIQLCHKYKVMTQEEALETLITQETKTHLWPKRIWLVEFEEIPPLYEAILQKLIPTIERTSNTISESYAQQFAAKDRHNEVQQAALWSRRVLEQEPEAVIGIIDPNLQSIRTELEQSFNRVFEPQTRLPHTARYAAPFNFSAGTPLAETPIIHHALSCFELLDRQFSIATISQLLLSPFVLANDEQQWIVNAEIDVALREMQNAQSNLLQMQSLIQRTAKKDDNGFDFIPLLKIFTQLTNLQRTWFKAKHPSEWRIALQQWLETLGWPGQRRLDSVEYQQVAQWYEALNSLAQFDTLIGRCTWKTLLPLMRQITQDAVFQAQTPESPIQILGLLEGAGLRFSHLWIMGMNEAQWPPAAAPNPLLPAAWQRELNMPRSSHSRELAYAQRLTQHFACSANEVIFSYCSQDADGETLAPSPLIATYPQREAQESTSTELHSINQSAQIEHIASWQAPPLSENELAYIRGGTELFKHQAQCPFIAFAIHRLNARPLAQVSLGLSPWEIGQAVHNCLEQFWRDTKNQQNLLAMQDLELNNRLNGLIQHELDILQIHHPQVMQEHYKNLQHQRMFKLLNNWMQAEKARPDFSVLAFEAQLDRELAGIPIQLRVDRIDKLSSSETLDQNHIAIIDYKTSEQQTSNWFGDRPDEPQMPMYFTLFEPTPDALVFAQVLSKQCSFKGVARDTQRLPGTRSAHQQRINDAPSSGVQWHDLKPYWEARLTQLAMHFRHGLACVSPKKNTSYQYTGLESLARLGDMSSLAEPLSQLNILQERDKKSNTEAKTQQPLDTKNLLTA